MADTVDIAFIPAFQNVIVGLYAEDPDQLTSTVRLRQGVVGKMDHWERLGGVKLVAVTSRHQTTPHTEMTHSRRRAIMADRAGSELLDQLDEVKMMIDPRNEYTQNLVRAYRVFIAETLVDSLDAASTVVAADDTTSTQALQASQLIAAGGTGFTMAKWRQANRILDNSGVPRAGRTALLSAFAVEDLLADATVTSKDYSDLAALQTGTIAGKMFMGAAVKVIGDAIPDDTATLTGGTADPILPKTGDIRSCFLYHHDAVGLSIGKVATPEVDKRADKMNSWQVLVQCSAAAVRILDAGVVRINIDESV